MHTKYVLGTSCFCLSTYRKSYIPWNLQMTNLKKIPLCVKHCFTRRGVGEVWKSFLLNCSPPHNDGQTNSSTFVTGTTVKKLITSFQQFYHSFTLFSWEIFITAHLCVIYVLLLPSLPLDLTIKVKVKGTLLRCTWFPQYIFLTLKTRLITCPWRN